jgi:hypothetical protein
VRTPIVLLFVTLTACGGSGPDQAPSPCGNALLDRIHCGSCDVVCPEAAACIDGVCGCARADQALCLDTCVDIVSNDENCGGCGIACNSGELCQASACTCKTGRKRCGDNCVDVASHALHCGGCDQACDQGGRCTDGACACPAGRLSCDGVCLDVSDDDENCGTCGNLCPEFTRCVSGGCRCNDGVGTLCDGVCIDTRTDEDNCGSCAEACVLGATCLGGDCSCRAARPATCDDRCVDLDADAFHCGECGQSCGAGQDCVDGLCKCQGLLTVCGDTCADTGTDADNCGGCGLPCELGEVCCGGECFPEECPERPLDVACNDTLDDLQFMIPPGGTRSWLLSAWVPDGAISMTRIQTPTTAFALSSGDYAFARRGTSFLDKVHPLLVPMAPGFDDLVAPGQHAASFSASGPPCYAVASSSGQGTTVRLRVILTGAPGIDADGAATDARWTVALAQANRVLQSAGIVLEVETYVDAEPSIATRYAVLREFDEVLELVATSQWPGLTPDSRLVLNVFVIQVFAVPAAGEVLGVSAGIPGAAGVHGTRASGVVVSIRDDATLLGNVLAHEAGHFLGLFHTTEVYGRASDPLPDTPICSESGWSNPRNCPGAGNLMFPYAQPGATEVTEDQAAVLRSNPLVR